MKNKIFRFFVLTLAVIFLLPLGTVISAVTVTNKKIPSIALTMYQPKPGDPIVNYYVSTTTPHITVQNDANQEVINGTRWWYYPDPYSSSSIGGSFDDGVYFYRVHISADFKFTDNIRYILPDASKVTLNGVPACDATISDPNNTFYNPLGVSGGTYVFPVTVKGDGIRIDNCSFNCKLPKLGEVSGPLTVTPSNPHVKVKRAFWTSRAYEYEEAEFVFENDRTYYIAIDVVCDNGYYFTREMKSNLLGADLHGVRMTGSKGSRNATVMYTYNIRDRQLGIYKDTRADVWYSAGIGYCVDNGYMSGISNNTFRPATALTRAMFLQILAKVKGVDLAEYEYSGEFYDVPYGRWFTNAVEWAYEKGVTAGTGEHQFSPDMPVTREQLATFLYAADGDETDSDLSKYTDANTVSPWALHAVKWCIGKSYISGTSATTLSPRENTTRAQAAVIFMNYAKSINK